MAGITTLLLAGCGGSSSSGSTASTFAEHCAETGLSPAEYGACVHRELADGRQKDAQEPEAKAGEPAEEPGGPLSYVGTIKASDGEGTTFTDQYRIGPLSYGEETVPPPSVLEECGITGPSEAAVAVFARGEITVGYSEGSYPEIIGVSPEHDIETEGTEGTVHVAFLVNGEWQCFDQEGPAAELEPGESVTFPIWLVGSSVLSNSQPRIPPDVLNTWHFRPLGGANTPLTSGEWMISGPGAANCEGEPRLLVYGQPPVQLPSHPPYGGMTCRAP